MGSFLSRARMKTDPEPRKRAAALPLLLWRRGPGRGGLVLLWFVGNHNDLEIAHWDHELDLQTRLRGLLPPPFGGGGGGGGGSVRSFCERPGFVVRFIGRSVDPETASGNSCSSLSSYSNRRLIPESEM